MNELVLADRAADWRRLKALILDNRRPCFSFTDPERPAVLQRSAPARPDTGKDTADSLANQLKERFPKKLRGR
jgi:hypothetical protein